MKNHTPRWLPWLCPVTAIIGAVVIAPFVFERGFWSTLIIAALCSLVPLAAYRLWQGFKRPN